MGVPSGYTRAIAFYQRSDVSDVLWELARRRPLSFYYWTDRDYRLRDAKRRRVALHCLAEPSHLRKAMGDAAASVSACPEPFYPFLTMGGRANSVDRPDVVVGWDLTLEADLDVVGSFRALTPLVAVLEHLGVPHLAKFSGQRSLHVVVPAEALAAALGHSSDQRDWFRGLSEIGRFLCRIVPALTATWVANGRDQPLTTPYSFHRYNGLLSLPLTLDSAMTFDPAVADPDRFDGVKWRPEHWSSSGDPGRELFELAQRSGRDPTVALRIAEAVFRGERWQRYLAEVTAAEPGDSMVEATIYAGPVSLGERVVDDRVRRAIAALDDPDVKTHSLQALFGGPGFRADFHLGRREASRALALWATAGVEAALDYLLDDALFQGTPRGRIARIVRLIGILPEPTDARLATAWETVNKATDFPRAVCLALALAEGGRWRTEDRPDLAIAALRDAFGIERVAGWLADTPNEEGHSVIDGVFRGDRRKVAFAARASAV